MATLQLAIDASRAKQGSAEFVAAANQVQNASDKAEKSVGILGKTSDSVGLHLKQAFIGVGASIAAGLAFETTLNTIKQFDEALARLRINSADTEQEFKALSDSAIRLGGESTFGPIKAAAALEQMTKAGADAQQAIEILPTSLKLAEATSLDLATSTGVLLRTMQQFGVETANSEQAADALASASRKTVGGMQSLGDALAVAGVAASNAHVSLGETTAAIETLTGAGLGGSMAGTQLRSIFTNLLTPTTQAKHALADVGLTISDVSLQSHTLSEVIQALADHHLTFAGALEIFTRRGGVAADALIRNADAFKEFSDRNEHATGTLKRMSDVMGGTIIADIQKFWSALEAGLLFNQGQTGFVGTVKTIITTFTQAVEILSGLASPATQANTSAQRLAETIRIISAGVAGLVAMKATQFIAGMATAVGELGVALLGIGSLNPITALAEIIGGATAALILFHDKQITIGDQTATLGSIMAVTWEHTWETIQHVALGAVETLEGAFSSMESKWKNVNDSMKAASTWLAKYVFPDVDAGPNYQKRLEEYRHQVDVDAAGDTSNALGGNSGLFGSGGESTYSIMQRVMAEARARDAAQHEADTANQDKLEKMRKRLGQGGDAGGEGDMTDDAASQARQQAIEQLQAMIDKYGVEISTIGQSNDIKQREMELSHAQALVTKSQIENGDEYIATLREEIDQYDRLKQAEDLAKGFGDTIANSFEQAVFSGGKLRDVIGGLISDLEKMVFRQAVTAPLAAALTSGLTGAFASFMPGMGEALHPSINTTAPSFIGDETVPIAVHALGDVVSSPTWFGSGGKMNVAGEAGPEGIFPLTRGAGGKLGVDASGMTGNTTIINQKIMINTPNSDSFRASRYQTANALRRAVPRG